ncbi:MAG: NUDIX hydrolase [Deltaproteobacteria bacterium]|nr:NUDIX hydrolase [Deltaproteobacteria bacterium]
MLVIPLEKRIENTPIKQVQEFVRRQPQCFERTCLEGHVTGSAFLLSYDLSKVLLTEHKKLDKWLQLGGHSDGNPNTAQVAYREAIEESGIKDLVFLSDDIMDVDVHLIPKTEKEPQHFHYDIRFFLKAPHNATFKVSAESHELKWFRPEEVQNLKTDRSLLRLVEIWKKIAAYEFEVDIREQSS